MEAARNVWINIMREGHSQTASMWLEQLKLECQFGDQKHARKTFLRALNCTKVSSFSEENSDLFCIFVSLVNSMEAQELTAFV